MNVSLRIARNADLLFLQRMLFEAAYWRPNQSRPPIEEALAHPDLAKLLDGWGRAGDAGVIAEPPDGQLVGAVWYRLWTEADHSYGYVDALTPELAIGVDAAARGQGIGAALLHALIDRASAANIVQLSLSVERDNPALRLYKRIGFEIVGEIGNAWTMTIKT